MEFINVVESRRSIRTYLEKKVESSKIDYIIECARRSPSWANRQCWKFIIVKDKSIIKELSKTSLINRWLKNAPIIVVACADPIMSGSNNGIDYFIVDVSIAMEHLILAATDVGLGTCWIGGFNEDKIKKILIIPKRIRVVSMTPLGYPSEKNGFIDKSYKFFASSKKRKNINEIIKYDKW
jgi:nitroreductase